MTKRQLIDEILSINRSADPSFLARFDDGQLDEYLTHLHWTRQPRLTGDASRYEHHFQFQAATETHQAQEPDEADPPTAVAEQADQDLDDSMPPLFQVDDSDDLSVVAEAEEAAEEPAQAGQALAEADEDVEFLVVEPQSHAESWSALDAGEPMPEPEAAEPARASEWAGVPAASEPTVEPADADTAAAPEAVTVSARRTDDSADSADSADLANLADLPKKPFADADEETESWLF